ncbi:MAG: hypothetical protein ACM3UZ_02445 [Acidobacteriota bacterium]
MTKNHVLRKLACLIMTIACWLGLTSTALARVHHYGSADIEGLLWTAFMIGAFIVFGIIFIIIRGGVINRHSKKISAEMQRMAQSNPIWNVDTLADRVREIYKNIDQARQTDDLSIIQGDVNQDIFVEIEKEVQEDIRFQRQYKSKDLNLDEVKPVGCSVSPTGRNIAWFLVDGNKTELKISRVTGKPIRNDDSDETGEDMVFFEEIWKLVYEEGRWVLHGIDNDVDTNDLKKLKEKTFKE